MDECASTVFGTYHPMLSDCVKLVWGGHVSRQGPLCRPNVYDCLLHAAQTQEAVHSIFVVMSVRDTFLMQLWWSRNSRR